jgi:hypothetical protein
MKKATEGLKNMYEAGSKWWPGGNMFLQNYI